jgi:hypothetical protein
VWRLCAISSGRCASGSSGKRSMDTPNLSRIAIENELFLIALLAQQLRSADDVFTFDAQRILQNSIARLAAEVGACSGHCEEIGT